MNFFDVFPIPSGLQEVQGLVVSGLIGPGCGGPRETVSLPKRQRRERLFFGEAAASWRDTGLACLALCSP